MTYLRKKFRFDICICGHTMKDMIYTLKKYPKESSDTRDATLVTRFGGISNTIRGIRYLNKKIKMKSIKLVFTLMIGTMIIAFTPLDLAAESTLDTVLKRGKVIVGVSSEAPPFGFIDEKGELVGFDIDIAKIIANKMFGEDGRIEFLKQGFAARWANANSGKIDFGIQITTVHSQRPTKVAFTRSYVDSGIVLVSKKGSGIKKIADANTTIDIILGLLEPTGGSMSINNMNLYSNYEN